MSSDPESSTPSEEPVAVRGAESLVAPRDTSTESQPPPSGARQLSAYEKFLAYERAKRGEGRGSEPPASVRSESASSAAAASASPSLDARSLDARSLDAVQPEKAPATSADESSGVTDGPLAATQPAETRPDKGPPDEAVHVAEDETQLDVEFDVGSAPLHDIPSALTGPHDADVRDAAEDALDRPSEVLLGDALLNWKRPETVEPVQSVEAPKEDKEGATTGVLLEHDETATPEAGGRGLFASPLRDLRRAQNRLVGTRVGAGAVFVVALGALAHYATRGDFTGSDPRDSQTTTRVDSKPAAATLANAAPQNATPQARTVQAAFAAPTAPKPGAAPELSAPSLNAASEHPIAKLLRLETQHDVGACEIPAGTPAGGPGASDQALRVGRAALARGVPADARAPLCLAAHHNPQNFMVTAALVQAYLLLGDASHATSVAAEALVRQPKVRILGELHADALIQEGKLDQALPVLLAALRITPADAPKFPAVAASYARAGKQAQRAADPAQAKRLFRRAALLDEGSVPAALGLSAVLTAERTKESLAAAAGWANYAIEREPENADAQLALGDALKAAGDLPSAKAAYERALALAPKHPKARARLAGL